MKNIWFIVIFISMGFAEVAGQSVNFNTLPAISSVGATTIVPTTNTSGRWRKMTLAQIQSFVMPRPVTRVAPTARYVLGYIPGSDSLSYIPGGIMSQLPLGNVTITTDTSTFNIQTLGTLNFTSAAWGSGWVNRIQFSREGSTSLSLLKGGQTITMGVDTADGARLRWNNIGLRAKSDSMFITPESVDSISVGEVLTVAAVFSNKAYIKSKPASGAGVSDGDKGDITVSSSGTVFTIDNNTIGSPQLASTAVAAGSYDLANITVDQDGRLQSAESGVIAASAVLDFPATTAGGTQDLTVSVTGASDGDVVAIGVPNACATVGTFFAWVSATDTVTIRFFNNSSGSVNPTSGTFKVKVFP